MISQIDGRIRYSPDEFTHTIPIDKFGNAMSVDKAFRVLKMIKERNVSSMKLLLGYLFMVFYYVALIRHFNNVYGKRACDAKLSM